MPKVTKTMTQSAKVLSGSDVPTYTLKFLNATRDFKAGEFDTIVVPHIEIGRTSSCSVRYGEEWEYVARKHAAIERSGNDIIIKNLSTKNPLLINDKPVKNQWFLNNGDQVQLAYEGPRFIFNTTPNRTSRMTFTNKMNLVARQALRPYKTAILGLLLLLVVSVVGTTYLLSKQKEQLAITETELERLKIEAFSKDSLYQVELISVKGFTDSLISNQLALINNLKSDNKNLKNVVNGIKNDISKRQNSLPPPPILPPSTKPMPSQFPKNDVYYFRVKNIDITYPDGSKEAINGGWQCTGFLCEDGKFITARHCIKSWRFLKSETDTMKITLNYIENNGGKIAVEFDALSPNGDKFSFSINDVVLPKDKDLKVPVEFGGKKSIFKISQDYSQDWAYVLTKKKNSSIRIDKLRSNNMQQGENVHVLGYSFGASLQSNSLKPLYSKSNVASDGLSNGLIYLTDRNFEQGNSGGPVLVLENNEYKVIGIVSAGLESIGFVVPVSAINK